MSSAPDITSATRDGAPAQVRESARARVFFAAWPDPQVAARLDALGEQLQRHCRGRLTRRDTLHLTLAFVGHVPRHRIVELLAIAQQLDAAAFSLQLDTLGSWARNRLAWAAPARIPSELSCFAEELAVRLRAAGFPIETRPFKPHVTLMRKLSTPFAAREIAPIAWRVSEFLLVESLRTAEGARYEPLGRWSLRT
jgi:RNA 2',3'-cyclic 3'-phosphodiesterase